MPNFSALHRIAMHIHHLSTPIPSQIHLKARREKKERKKERTNLESRTVEFGRATCSTAVGAPCSTAAAEGLCSMMAASFDESAQWGSTTLQVAAIVPLTTVLASKDNGRMTDCIKSPLRRISISLLANTSCLIQASQIGSRSQASDEAPCASARPG